MTEDVPDSPLTLLRRWLDAAQTAGVASAGDAIVATADLAGQPCTRVLALRDIDDDGLIFFTNLASRKGRDLAANPRLAATFYWSETAQQINITGIQEELGDSISDRLWAERGPVGTAVSIVSEQGHRLDDETRLRERITALVDAGVLPPRPAHHAAIRLVPKTVEFWQGEPDRVHQRLHYQRTGEHWRHWRLQP